MYIAVQHSTLATLLYSRPVQMYYLNFIEYVDYMNLYVYIFHIGSIKVAYNTIYMSVDLTLSMLSYLKMSAASYSASQTEQLRNWDILQTLLSPD